MGPTKKPPPIGQTSKEAVFMINTGEAIVDRILISLRQKLMETQKISFNQLIALEQPIWEAVHDRYGVAYPRYLQGHEVEQ